MKKYKNGLILGKMYPFTKGHQYIIDTAIQNCEHTHIIISHNKTQSIPGNIRFDAIKNTYKYNKSVTVYQFEDDGFPQYDYECESLDEFYSYWVPEILNLVQDLDVVFTSEDYGDDFAKYLGVEHFLVDKERTKFPISGTAVRNDPFKEWDLINSNQRGFFVKRIALMGPESVGKSTLSKKLSTYFNTNFVIEYGRLVYENNGNKVDLHDFIPISEGRQSLEDWCVSKANKVIFCDTEDITTYLFLKKFCKDKEHISEENWFKEKIKNSKKYDLYLLLKPDCEAVQDGTRVFLDNRDEHYEEIKESLKQYGCNFVEIGGSWEERFNESVKILKSNFNI